MAQQQFTCAIQYSFQHKKSINYWFSFFKNFVSTGAQRKKELKHT